MWKMYNFCGKRIYLGMKIFLKSPFACLVKTPTAQCVLGPNDTAELDGENYIFVYPQNTKRIPFLVDLESQRDCEKYSFFCRGEKRYVVLENDATYFVKSKEKLNFSGKIVEILIGNGLIRFETSEKQIECLCENDDEFSCFKINSFACVQFPHELFLFSTKEGKVYHFCGEIEVDSNHICVTKKFEDSDAHEKKTTFRIDDDIEVEDEQIFSHATPAKLKDLAPFKLLECVKAKDYAHALSFLSKKMQEQIDVAQIREFFGNFTTFLPVSTTEFILIGGKTKNFVHFSMSDNEIDDISVDNLE